GHRPRRIDWRVGVGEHAVAAYCVEVLEREPERLHDGVAAGADGLLAVQRHLLTNGYGLAVLGFLREPFDVGRWRWWRCPQQVLEDPLSASHRRRASGV